MTACSGAMDVVDDILNVPVGGSVDAEALAELTGQVLQQVRDSGARGVVVNVAGIRILDSAGFVALQKLARGISLLGARAVFVGFQAGVVSTLVDLTLETDSLCTAVTSADAREFLTQQRQWQGGHGEGMAMNAAPHEEPNGEMGA